MQKLHFEREVLQKLTSGQENSDFAREVARSREKVAYRVDGTPTLESMVSRETSRKKSRLSVRFLSFRRKVMQKLNIPKSLFGNTVKRECFAHARLCIFVIDFALLLLWFTQTTIQKTE